MRLKVKVSSLINLVLYRFNSILVRLKGKPLGKIKLNCPLFQFHIGAIKRQGTVAIDTSISLFQFHIGAIKSQPFQLLSF